MSKVFSFRLDKNNPREARALEVIETQRAEGLGLRHIITAALLALDLQRTDLVSCKTHDEISETLKRVTQLLEKIEKRNNSSQKDQDASSDCSKLTDNFVASIKRAAKPGMKLGRAI